VQEKVCSDYIDPKYVGDTMVVSDMANCAVDETGLVLKHSCE
jgi:hypothetical protein